MLAYRFRPFTDADLPLVERWLATAEVARWWGDPAKELALLKDDLDEPLMRQRIVEHNERPFAYAQAYEAHAWPQRHLQHLTPGKSVHRLRSSGWSR
jgi:aminoglycoside 6'-N-acetyltransferase